MPAKSKKAPFKLSWKLFLVIGLAVVCVLAVLELTNTTHVFHKPKAVSGTIPSTSPSLAKVSNDAANPPSAATNNDSSSGNKQNSTSGSGGGATSSGTSNDTTLLAPSGNFVSNHHPNLNGSPAPTQERSVCNTSPGASCYIKFVNSDGVVKTLSSKTADSGGAVYWDWDVKQAGFTKDAWTITAIASLGSQTKTASDSLGLEVQP